MSTLSKNNRKLEKLETPYTCKNGHTYAYALTLDCGHVRYLNDSGADTFLTGWKDADRMICKSCARKLENMNAMLESVDDFTDWNY